MHTPSHLCLHAPVCMLGLTSSQVSQALGLSSQGLRRWTCSSAKLELSAGQKLYAGAQDCDGGVVAAQVRPQRQGWLVRLQ